MVAKEILTTPAPVSEPRPPAPPLTPEDSLMASKVFVEVLERIDFGKVWEEMGISRPIPESVPTEPLMPGFEQSTGDVKNEDAPGGSLIGSAAVDDLGDDVLPQHPTETKPKKGFFVTKEMHRLDMEALARTQAGDREAFGEICERYWQRIYNQIYYRIGDPERAAELTQDVFLRAFEHVGEFRDTGARYITYLLIIAHNLTVDHYRAKREMVSIENVVLAAGDKSDPTVQAEIAIESLQLKYAVEQLKPNFRAVVVMYYLRQMEYPEIAKAIGKSEGAVRVILHRALKGLGLSMGRIDAPKSDKLPAMVDSGRQYYFKDIAERTGRAFHSSKSSQKRLVLQILKSHGITLLGTHRQVRGFIATPPTFDQICVEVLKGLGPLNLEISQRIRKSWMRRKDAA